MRFLNKLAACVLAGLLVTGVAVADEKKEASDAAWEKAERQWASLKEGEMRAV